MKLDEIKIRINGFLNQTIDTYIPKVTGVERLKNSTLKLWMNQNIGKLDPILNMFKDETGDIDIQYIIHHYEDELFIDDEFKLDMREIVPRETDVIQDMLPDKLILFHKEDLKEIFEDKNVEIT